MNAFNATGTDLLRTMAGMAETVHGKRLLKSTANKVVHAPPVLRLQSSRLFIVKMIYHMNDEIHGHCNTLPEQDGEL